MTTKPIAFVLKPGAQPGQRLVYVTFREDGYTPTVYDDPAFSQEDCQHIADELNAENGVTREIALSTLHGSMFGWHVPGAQAAIAHFSLFAPADDQQ